ncbi:MAG: carboxymuconolactone decarboxylase family protein [Bacteroidota bacterium]
MRSLIERSIVQHEGMLGVELDYLRSLADVSSGLFTKFTLAIPATAHRKHAPLHAWHLARLGATRVQDCGTCVQYVVNAALHAGASPEVLRAALDNDASSLGDADYLALQFGEAVAARTPEAEDLRVRLVEAVGDEAAVEIALAVAMAQIYPILKRGLGQTVACALVTVEVNGSDTDAP